MTVVWPDIIVESRDLVSGEIHVDAPLEYVHVWGGFVVVVDIPGQPQEPPDVCHLLDGGIEALMLGSGDKQEHDSGFLHSNQPPGDILEVIVVSISRDADGDGNARGEPAAADQGVDVLGVVVSVRSLRVDLEKQDRKVI